MSDKPLQIEMFAVPSPCINVCQSGPKGYCLGCFRSREERIYWLQIDNETKRTIVKACFRRKRADHARRLKKSKDALQSLEQEQQKQQELF